MEVFEGGTGTELLGGPWLLDADNGNRVEVSAAVRGGAVARACLGGTRVGGFF